MNKSFNNSADSTVAVFTGLLDTAQKVNKIIDYVKTHFDKNDIDICLNGFDLVRKINDVSSLFAIANLDLAVSSKMLYNASNNWEKIYVKKNVYLTVFEIFKTFSKYGKFLNELSENALPHLKENFVNINNSIKVFKKEYKYEADMKIIRNNISGHISDDVDLYYNTIIQFDGDKTGEMIIEFFKITNDLHNFLTDILEQNYIREKNQQVLIMAKEVIPNFNEMLFK
ncbi:hypothetical protein SAMN05421800_102349 [Chryseobacterium balustinum]|uniref:HEPN AbiU2-like domain-containing protein n=2 Tax=Chryseobacterium balustinum TaxID=246 RepID=A0AAX2IJ66_9FLAO|nr:hypothetical protein SAMN05421800_102349 [Chryseobacterium balustinum]SQA88930.1 Uncharacterised protein [Chryseobacterium balustinum]